MTFFESPLSGFTYEPMTLFGLDFCLVCARVGYQPLGKPRSKKCFKQVYKVFLVGVLLLGPLVPPGRAWIKDAILTSCRSENSPSDNTGATASLSRRVPVFPVIYQTSPSRALILARADFSVSFRLESSRHRRTGLCVSSDEYMGAPDLED